MRTVGNQFRHNVGIGEEKRKNWRTKVAATNPPKSRSSSLRGLRSEWQVKEVCEASERRAAGLFERVRELEDASFAKGRTEDLQADREIFLRRFAAGYGDAGDAGEGAGDSVDVCEVHLER